MRKPQSYREWFLFIVWLNILLMLPMDVIKVVSRVAGDPRGELLHAPGELLHAGRFLVVFFCIQVSLRWLAAVLRKRLPDTETSRPARTPAEEDLQFVEGISLVLQILTAPFVVVCLLFCGVGKLVTGQGWDGETWRVGLFCAAMFVGMHFWRAHARRHLAPPSGAPGASASTS
jgi:hypothetical protein